MGKARSSSRARSYIPNTTFLFLSLIIQLLKTIKPAHKILSLTHRKCRGKPNIWILPPLLQKNKYGRSQLYRNQIFSHTIYLYNRKFDWCLIVVPISLVWHTYISGSLNYPSITYPTRRLRDIFFYKKKITKKWFSRPDKIAPPLIAAMFVSKKLFLVLLLVTNQLTH